jgi:hypothetical protein
MPSKHHHRYKNQSVSEIRTKHSTQSEHSVEFLNVKPGDM